MKCQNFLPADDRISNNNNVKFQVFKILLSKPSSCLTIYRRKSFSYRWVDFRLQVLILQVIRNTQLVCPRFSTSIGEMSFVVRVLILWNQLPLALRNFSNTSSLFRVNDVEHLCYDCSFCVC